MKKLMILCCFLYLLCTAMSCPDGDLPVITIVNKSDKNLYIQISKHYPDTFLCKDMDCDIWGMSPHTISEDAFYHISREDLFKKITYLQIMVCSEDLDMNLPIDSLRKYQNKFVLKRYQLTKHELDSMNWTIVYP